MEYIIAVILAVVASVPGIYAVYRQMRKDSGDKQALFEQLRVEQQENLAEYELALKKSIWEQAQTIVNLQAGEIDKLKGRIEVVEKERNRLEDRLYNIESENEELKRQIALLQIAGIESKEREHQWLIGIRTLIRQIRELGLDPKWEPPNGGQ